MMSRVLAFILPVFIVILFNNSWIAIANVVSLETDDYVIIENSHLKLVVAKDNRKGLISFIDKKTGRDFIVNALSVLPMYKIITVHENQKELILTNQDASNFSYHIKKSPGSAKLVAIYNNHASQNIRLIVQIELTRGSPITKWQFNIENSSNLTIKAIQLPFVNLPKQLGDSPADDHLVLPHCDGLLLTDLTQKGLRRSHSLSYPGGASLQFLAFYDDSSGIYLAAYDSKGNPKAFGFNLRNNHVELYIENRVPEVKGNDVFLEYEMAVGVFHGKSLDEPASWYDAADIYKDWAIKQPWCAKKTMARDDIPVWFKAGPPLVNYYISHDQSLKHISIQATPQLIKQYSDYLGRNILARPTGWEKHGGWIGPDCFPPYGGGEFEKSIEQLRANGNRGLLYLEGYQWMLNDPKNGYNGHDFFRKWCGDCVVKKRDGGIESKHNNRQYAVGCRTTVVAQDALFTNAMKAVDLGADAIQIEVVGGGGGPCYNKNHSHPPGYGKWIYKNFAELLDRVRTEGKNCNHDFVLTIEEPGELYIQHLDGYNGRDYRQLAWPRGWPGSVGIPLFTYIYHEYALGFSGWHNVRNKSLMQLRDMAANLICGKMDGISISTSRGSQGLIHADRNAISFYKEITTAISTYAKDYLLFGKMLRPTNVQCESFTFNYTKKVGEKWKSFPWTEPQVLHSVWQAPSGKIGYVFVNFSDDTAEFECEVRPYSLGSKRCSITCTNDGETKNLLKDVYLPKILKLSLEPRKVMLIEVYPTYH